MVDSTSCAALELVRAAPDATIALEQASSSLPCGRSRRLERLVLRPEATDPVESTIYAAGAIGWFERITSVGSYQRFSSASRRCTVDGYTSAGSTDRSW